MVTDYQFLKGLIPDTHKEEVFETSTHYACRVTGPRLTDKEWDNLTEKIINEFGSELMEIDSNTNYGVDFIVFLKNK